MGMDLYHFMSNTGEATHSGIGDWFFRQAAFPAEPDNTETYFRRFFPLLSEELKKIKAEILGKRNGLDAYFDELITKHRLDQANVVGLASMFSQNVGCFALARKLKQHNPKAIIVMGGANCESPMGQEIIKHVEQIDYVFSGPALKSFPTFIEAVINGKRERCEQIRGIFTKDNVARPPSIIGEEMDINSELAVNFKPFLDQVRTSFPNKEVKPILIFETSRGCWWGEKAHCTFCGLNGLTMNYRSMRPDKAIEMFGSLFKHSGEAPHLMCTDNIMPTNYPTEVFPYLNAPAAASIFYEVKADLTAEEMQQMSQARVKLIQPGIEALSTSTLKLMKKGTTVFQNLAFLKNCLLYDLYPSWNLLVGFPGEDEEVYRKYFEDMPLLVHLPPPVTVGRVMFDRYSPYFNEAEKYGLQLQPSDYYTLIYPFAKEEVDNLAYHFVDGNANAKYIHAMAKWIAKLRGLLVTWQSRWQTSDPFGHPQLYLKENEPGTVVHDSRAGAVLEHEISPTGKLILENLVRPKRVSQLARELTDVNPSSLATEVSLLKERGLLFQEGDRFLSLVMPKELPRFSVNLVTGHDNTVIEEGAKARLNN
jgi:ribosomal peptide maturation radical SAM protein 1